MLAAPSYNPNQSLRNSWQHRPDQASLAHFQRRLRPSAVEPRPTPGTAGVSRPHAQRAAKITMFARVDTKLHFAALDFTDIMGADHSILARGIERQPAMRTDRRPMFDRLPGRYERQAPPMAWRSRLLARPFAGRLRGSRRLALAGWLGAYRR